jgi:hypothetical protein
LGTLCAAALQLCIVGAFGQFFSTLVLKLLLIVHALGF